MEQGDPDAYRSEVRGEFRAGISTLFDPAVLQDAVDRGMDERARGRFDYAAHFDASGGRSDAAALAIGHTEDDELMVLDCLRRWAAPHKPATVIAEAADVVKSYGVREVQIDRFAGDYPSAAFMRHGVGARVCESNTSDNYLALLPRVNAGRVLLLDVPEMLRELRGLERRAGTAGKDRVLHRGGAHDDMAAAVAGLAVTLTTNAGDFYPPGQGPVAWFPDWSEDTEQVVIIDRDGRRLRGD